MKLEKIIIKKNGLSKIKISEDKDNHTVSMGKNILKISSGGYSKGGEYNRTKNETTWYLRHCCGSHGFGQGLDDVCNCCRSNGETTDKQIGQYSGNRNLRNIISYSLRIEKRINAVFQNIELALAEKKK